MNSKSPSNPNFNKISPHTKFSQKEKYLKSPQIEAIHKTNETFEAEEQGQQTLKKKGEHQNKPLSCKSSFQSPSKKKAFLLDSRKPRRQSSEQRQKQIENLLQQTKFFHGKKQQGQAQQRVLIDDWEEERKIEQKYIQKKISILQSKNITQKQKLEQLKQQINFQDKDEKKSSEDQIKSSGIFYEVEEENLLKDYYYTELKQKNKLAMSPNFKSKTHDKFQCSLSPQNVSFGDHINRETFSGVPMTKSVIQLLNQNSPQSISSFQTKRLARHFQGDANNYQEKALIKQQDLPKQLNYEATNFNENSYAHENIPNYQHFQDNSLAPFINQTDLPEKTGSFSVQENINSQNQNRKINSSQINLQFNHQNLVKKRQINEQTILQKEDQEQQSSFIKIYDCDAKDGFLIKGSNRIQVKRQQKYKTKNFSVLTVSENSKPKFSPKFVLDTSQRNLQVRKSRIKHLINKTSYDFHTVIEIQRFQMQQASIRLQAIVNQQIIRCKQNLDEKQNMKNLSFLQNQIANTKQSQEKYFITNKEDMQFYFHQKYSLQHLPESFILQWKSIQEQFKNKIYTCFYLIENQFKKLQTSRKSIQIKPFKKKSSYKPGRLKSKNKQNDSSQCNGLFAAQYSNFYHQMTANQLNMSKKDNKYCQSSVLGNEKSSQSSLNKVKQCERKRFQKGPMRFTTRKTSNQKDVQMREIKKERLQKKSHKQKQYNNNYQQESLMLKKIKYRKCNQSQKSINEIVEKSQYNRMHLILNKLDDYVTQIMETTRIAKHERKNMSKRLKNAKKHLKIYRKYTKSTSALFDQSNTANCQIQCQRDYQKKDQLNKFQINQELVNEIFLDQLPKRQFDSKFYSFCESQKEAKKFDKLQLPLLAMQTKIARNPPCDRFEIPSSQVKIEDQSQIEPIIHFHQLSYSQEFAFDQDLYGPLISYSQKNLNIDRCLLSKSNQQKCGSKRQDNGLTSLQYKKGFNWEQSLLGRSLNQGSKIETCSQKEKHQPKIEGQKMKFYQKNLSTQKFKNDKKINQDNKIQSRQELQLKNQNRKENKPQIKNLIELFQILNQLNDAAQSNKDKAEKDKDTALISNRIQSLLCEKNPLIDTKNYVRQQIDKISFSKMNRQNQLISRVFAINNENIKEKKIHQIKSFRNSPQDYSKIHLQKISQATQFMDSIIASQVNKNKNPKCFAYEFRMISILEFITCCLMKYPNTINERVGALQKQDRRLKQVFLRNQIKCSDQLNNAIQGFLDEIRHFNNFYLNI